MITPKKKWREVFIMIGKTERLSISSFAYLNGSFLMSKQAPDLGGGGEEYI